MSDTIQSVRWSLETESDTAEHMWLPPGHERPNDLFWESVRRTGIESQLRDAFQVTDPLWYGFWIDSPLSQTQCQILSTLFTDLVSLVPRYRDRLEAFIDALNRSLETAEQLHVELTPPGHVDMGWITTFVHCPRCKADGPFEPWQESYPEKSINCPTCGFSFSPAATHSTKRDYFAPSVECGRCHTSHRIKDFSEDEIQILEDHHDYREACHELAWLRRVDAFYERHPDYENQIKPHFLMVLDSDDPKVQEDMRAGVPLDEISLPAMSRSVARDWSAEDREVIDYLRHHYFSLQPRMKGVLESIDRLKPIVATKSLSCPSCGGKLQ